MQGLNSFPTGTLMQCICLLLDECLLAEPAFLWELEKGLRAVWCICLCLCLCHCHRDVIVSLSLWCDTWHHLLANNICNVVVEPDVILVRYQYWVLGPQVSLWRIKSEFSNRDYFCWNIGSHTHWQLSKTIWHGCDCNGTVSFFMQKTFLSFIARICHNKYFSLY